MRIPNQNKYEAILDAARSEFLTRGFKDASMRGIGQAANVGVSNIYNYFLSKDDLYATVVKPARDELFKFMTEQHGEDSIEQNRTSTFGHKKEAVNCYIDLISKHKREIRLLLFHSEGSSMQGFRDEFTDHMTRVSIDYMELEKRRFPMIKEVSPFLIHVISSSMVNILGEIVTHDMSKNKIRDFFREYFRFEFAGWRELTASKAEGDIKCLPLFFEQNRTLFTNDNQTI